jgi:hypothetical protein
LRDAFDVIDNGAVLSVSNNSLNRSSERRSANGLQLSEVERECDTFGDRGFYRERLNLLCLLLLKDVCASYTGGVVLMSMLLDIGGLAGARL